MFPRDLHDSLGPHRGAVRRSPFRAAIVREQDPASGRVRVAFPDRDNLLSYWLPIVVPKSQNDKAYWIPDIGEQVVCLMDEHDEDGCVLGAIYSAVDTPPVSNADKWYVSFKDGAAIEYDRAQHALSITLPAGATVSIGAGSATIQIDSSGDILLNAAGLVKLAGGGPGIARVGDATTCPAGTGQITSGSSKVLSG